MPSEDPHPRFSPSPVTSKLTCSICQRLLNRPIQLACDNLVCCTCLCESICTDYSLQCPCCKQHTLDCSTISRPSTILLSLLEEVVISCVKNCNNQVMVKNYSMHLAGHCKVYSEDIKSPSKVTTFEVSQDK